MKFGFKFGLLGAAGQYTPPILSGDFIWYSLNPDGGYLTDAGQRYVNDLGNTIRVPPQGSQPYGTKNGLMLSGNYLNNAVTYPLNETYLTYFDVNTRSFVQGQTGDITVPHNMVFTSNRELTPNELQEITDEPEKLFKLFSGLSSLTDGFSLTDIINFWTGLETQGDIRSLIKDNDELGDGNNMLVSKSGETGVEMAVGVDFVSYKNTGNGTAEYKPILQKFLQSTGIQAGDKFKLSFDIDVDLQLGLYGIQVYGTRLVPDRTLLSAGHHEFVGEVTDPTRLEANIYLNGANYMYDFNLTNVSIKQTNDIPYTGTRTLNSPVGAQTLRVIQDVDGRVTELVGTHQMKFSGNGSTISTGISIDGTLSDFTALMSFTIEAGEYYIVNSGGAGQDVNRFFLYAADTVVNKLQVGIGRFTQIITFDDKPIHAICVIYNSATSQLQIAIDGEPLGAPFDIVFDGQTGQIVFGGESLSFTGYIGEGILSAVIEPEDTWFKFWERVKHGKPVWWSVVDDADIIGVWDFADAPNEATALTDRVNGLQFSAVQGTPSWTAGTGFSFDGGGVLAFPLPDIDVTQMSIIIEVADCTQNGTLDSVFGGYDDANNVRFIYQLAWNTDLTRWTCGDGTATSAENAPNLPAGVIGTSGVVAYKNGVRETNESSGGNAIASGYDFPIGAAYINGAYGQHIKGTIRRALVVNRLITDAEHQDIYTNIRNAK